MKKKTKDKERAGAIKPKSGAGYRTGQKKDAFSIICPTGGLIAVYLKG